MCYRLSATYRYGLMIILWGCFGWFSPAQGLDSLVVRQPNPDAVSALRKSPELRYDGIHPPQQEGVSWISLFWKWYRHVLEQLFGKSGAQQINNWMPWILLVLVLLLIGWVVTKAQRNSILTSSSGGKAIRLYEGESLDTFNFAAAIQKAEAKGDFREAIRLIFLQNLKTLQDQGVIQWKKDKTNHDYLREVRGSSYESGFRLLIRHFELVWYGGWAIQRAEYEAIRQDYFQPDTANP